MSANPDSMLPRILQSCSITMYRKTLHFMVIENIFFTPDGVVRPSAVYDIKGSWVDRNASGTRTHRPTSGTFKDQDLNDRIYLPIEFRERLQATLYSDTSFLARHAIMDYSLLLGVCKRPFHSGEFGVTRQAPPAPPPAAAAGGGSTTSPPFFRVDGGGMSAALIEGNGSYHMGLIDILQVWDVIDTVCFHIIINSETMHG
eukprot:COSAG05_NODE_36_length_27735_cov_238.370893_11_plen_201_part_00